MQYSDFVGKPRIHTGVQGICYDFLDGVRVWFPEGDFCVMCVDADTSTVIEEKHIVAGKEGELYFLPYPYMRWYVEIRQFGKTICTFEYISRKKNILMNCWSPINRLGDTLYTVVMLEQFRKKYACNIFAIVAKQFKDFFQHIYPDITFIEWQNEDLTIPYGMLPENIYASYNVPLFYISYNKMQITHMVCPVDYRFEGCLKSMAGKLGLMEFDFEKQHNYFSANTGRPFQEHYVCISGRGSDEMKEWSNPDGWAETVKYLKQMGYRVLCIDGDKINKGSPLEKALAEGLEDFTGYRPLQEKVDLLYHADFFVGISSGLSWLAWGTGKPVVLISGFTLPYNEFHTPYRVINYRVCNGCYNRMSVSQEPFPCENTVNYLECSRCISAMMVCKNIDKLMQDYHFLPPNDSRKI